MIRKFFWMGGVAFTLFAASGASAQTAGDAGDGAASNDIIVTAQKRAERLEEVPISITQVEGERLEQQGISGLRDLGRVAVGLNVSRIGPYILPSIRGITTSATGILAENNSAIYVDGFYIPNQVGINLEFNDVDQVSVLKGPQGTLFGRNATGGAILITTLDPDLDDARAKVGASYGRFDDVRVNAYASVPLGEKLALSVAGALRNSDGYVKDIAGFDSAPVRNRAVKAKLRVDPTENLSMILGFEYYRLSDAIGNSWTMVESATVPSLIPGAYVETRPNRTSLSFPSTNQSDIYAPSLKITADLGSTTLTSLTRFSRQQDLIAYDLDGSPEAVSSTVSVQNQKNFSQEVNLAYREGPIDAVVGAFYFWNKADNPIASDFRGTPSRLFSAGRGSAWAVFGDMTYHVSDRLSLIGGLRYSKEKKIFDRFVSNGVTVASDAEATFDSFTPRAVVRYELAPRTHAYASFSKGFKSGAFNQYSASTVPVRPEKITAYEVGVKTVSGPFRLDTSAYYYDYTDLQVSAVVPGPGGIGRVSVLTNAASAEIYGAEMQASYDVGSNFTVTASVNYNHGRFKSFPNAPATLKDPVTGFNILNQTQDWSGTRLLRAPDWTGTLSADYGIPLSSGQINLRGNLYGTTSYTTQTNSLRPDGSYRYEQKGYVLANGEIAWTSGDGSYSIALYGRNLTDRKIVGENRGTAFGDIRTYEEPRTFGVRLSGEF